MIISRQTQLYVIKKYKSEKICLNQIKEKLEPNEIEIPMEFPQSKHLARIAGICFDGVHTQIIQEDAGEFTISLSHYINPLRQEQWSQRSVGRPAMP